MEEVERIPWIPFVGCHAGNLLGISASEYLKSKEHIVNGVSKSVDMYNPDGIPVMFDLQVEAEALGCTLNWSDENPPAVTSHPLADGTDLKELKVPGKEDGRIPMIMEATRELRARHPDIAIYGLVTGPFTLALHLLGTDIFMRFFEDPDYVHQLMQFTTKVAGMMTEQYLDAGCDVIALVDPMTSQIDPSSFETFVSPYAREIFEQVREKNALSSFFVCGYAQQNIEVMCDCNPDNVSIDENIPLDYVRDVALSKGVSFGGNIKLTVSLLLGSEEDSMRDALECMDIGGKKGFLLAPGCDLPMATPPENLQAVTRLVHDEHLQGELRASEAKVEEVEPIDLTGHWKEDKLVIDVVTLDSSSCAPCQYMVDAVERASKPFGDKVLYKEYSIKQKEGVQMMAALGLKTLPAIVMDGNLEFMSQIPPISIIEERISEYLKGKSS